jgi:hypothetical protein
MDRQVKRQRTLEAIKRILLLQSLNQPVIVIFEDLLDKTEGNPFFIEELVQALFEQVGAATQRRIKIDPVADGDEDPTYRSGRSGLTN